MQLVALFVTNDGEESVGKPAMEIAATDAGMWFRNDLRKGVSFLIAVGFERSMETYRLLDPPQEDL